MSLVVGTAGHIDHGKTTLLRALTGIDADRLPEERARGMTIDVGYAHLTLPDGTVIDFVDVPGHDRLVGNMLVGAGEIDAAMLVVAADDGPRAQTVEHLELLDAIGLSRGLAVVTKVDTVEPARVAEVANQVGELLAGTALRGVPVLAASGATGVGLDAVRAAIARLTTDREALTLTAPQTPRLAIDRVFSVRGRGAVVTGTLRGSIRRGDTLVLEPERRTVRVREVQVRGVAVFESRGGRTALNLAGIEASRLARGQVLAAPGVVRATSRLLAAIRTGDRPSDRTRYRLHVGTDQTDARVAARGRETADLGAAGMTVVVRLDGATAVAPGDRFVLRAPGRPPIGGLILDPEPPRGVSRRRATPGRLNALASAVAAGDAADFQTARLDLHGAIVEAGSRTPALAPDVRAAAANRAAARVGEEHRDRPDQVGPSLDEVRAEVGVELRRLAALDREAAAVAAVDVVERVVAGGALSRAGDRLRHPDHHAAGPAPPSLAAMDRLVASLDVAAPPALSVAARDAGCPPDAVRWLERDGRIIRVDDDLAWSAAAWQRLARHAIDAATARPLTPAALRDTTGTSRKYVMALLEDLGRRAILVRTPTGHVPGPRAGQLALGGRAEAPVG